MSLNIHKVAKLVCHHGDVYLDSFDVEIATVTLFKGMRNAITYRVDLHTGRAISEFLDYYFDVRNAPACVEDKIVALVLDNLTKQPCEIVCILKATGLMDEAK